MILYNAGKPRPVGGELQSEYKNRPQDNKTGKIGKEGKK